MRTAKRHNKSPVPVPVPVSPYRKNFPSRPSCSLNNPSVMNMSGRPAPISPKVAQAARARKKKKHLRSRSVLGAPSAAVAKHPEIEGVNNYKQTNSVLSRMRWGGDRIFLL